MVFQGKPFNDDNREHLIIELGDLMWYVAQATQALGISMDEVLETNVNKLKKRYPVVSLTSTCLRIALQTIDDMSNFHQVFP